MKKNIILPIAIFVCTCIAGCKGDSIPASGHLGKLPGVVKKYCDELNTLEAKLAKSGDTKEMQAIVEKGTAVKKEAEEQVETLESELVEKEIPGEVAQDVPMKIVSPFKIKGIRKDGTVMLEGEVELTEDCAYAPEGAIFNLSNVRVMAIGDDENDAYAHIGGGFKSDKYADLYPKGTKGVVSTYLAVEGWNAEMMGRLSKLIIANKTGDIFKKVREDNKKAERDYKNNNK